MAKKKERPVTVYMSRARGEVVPVTVYPSTILGAEILALGLPTPKEAQPQNDDVQPSPSDQVPQKSYLLTPSDRRDKRRRTK